MKISVFTIVFNGMPWLPKIYDTLCELADFRWSIVHGIADPVGDTAWCKRIETRPDDGTLDWIQSVALADNRVTVLSQERWPGKTPMCNAALGALKVPGILVQMDADEIWTQTQLSVLPSLFERHPTADAAMFLCRYWVGPNRYVCTPNAFGNHCAYEWVRAWRYEPGMTFEAHEPPMMRGCTRYISHGATAQLGLVFDHFAYADRSQIQFKADYYGPEYSVEAWDRLQTMRGPVDLCGVLPWVKAPIMSYEA